MTTRTLDTATVLSYASPAARKLTSTGNARFTFPDHRTPDNDGVVWRKATAAEVKRDRVTCTGDDCSRCAACIGTVRTTLEQQRGESLRTVSTSSGWGGMSRKGFTAPTGKTVTPIGAWVTVDGIDGQVWSEGSATGTVWVALVTGEYVETSHAQVTSEPVADVLPIEVPTVDVDAARDLAARAEATGRDGVEFVRQAMGDDAADALEGADTPAPTLIGYLSQVGPMRSNATCVHCGQASGEEPSRDVRAYVMAGASWDAVECIGAHCTECADVDAAQWYMRTAECQVQREAHAHALPIGPDAPPQVMRVIQDCTPDVFAQRMHALRRRHLRLQAWRLATA